MTVLSLKIFCYNKTIKLEYRNLKNENLYPSENIVSTGLSLELENNSLVLKGSAIDLIEFADLLIALAISGEDKGQHFHIDNLTLIDNNSKISEVVLQRK